MSAHSQWQNGSQMKRDWHDGNSKAGQDGQVQPPASVDVGEGCGVIRLPN